MKLVVADPRRSHRIDSGSGNRTAKGTTGPEAHVIEHDEQHIGPPLAPLVEL